MRLLNNAAAHKSDRQLRQLRSGQLPLVDHLDAKIDLLPRLRLGLEIFLSPSFIILLILSESSKMLPKTMKAIKIVSAGHAEIQEVPLPKLRDDYVLVKTKCVARETNRAHVLAYTG